MIWENGFSPLEIVLMSAVTSLVGGIVLVVKMFYSYLLRTNKERAGEIASSVKVQTQLEGAIEKHNYLIEQLPDRLHDKIKAAVKS